ncbi:P-loop containing nucleoside triphosphate hydrolase protein [Penicillium odoratum]|uniref:P-loop containing nucleoside triphosphate hydrolase protein n=1 Tax=Penicillium odoratum TaxID=1167516 RepID=UPI002549A867|nr:P-loop containing nucleoside triphosphate hydrolase protein [Penicillium odoratum]KAJ5777479.1 P-loop containing nucleoside triphosphate hydrolase protein [Penicillium odoratum]
MSQITFSDFNNSGSQIADNRGTVNNHFYPPEQPQAPPIPLSTVPFCRDPDFVDRGSLLDIVQEKSSTSASRLALVGLGGVGKSQLAIEYSYRVRDQSPDTWVFWVYASNTNRFEQSYKEIANRVKVPGRNDPKANVIQLVYDWLQDSRGQKWVLILDNLDDDQFLYKPLAIREDENSHRTALKQPLLSFLPRSLHGTVIITTRSKRVALNLLNENDIIPIEPMEKSDAFTLRKQKLGNITCDGSTEGHIEKLTEALEFMPLAIVQAAANIKNKASRCSVARYLEDFQRSDQRKIKLLDYDVGHYQRDHEAKKSILVTWQISFQHIRHIRKSAADLLSLMSFFDRQGISESLVRKHPRELDDCTEFENRVPRSISCEVINCSKFGDDDEFGDDIDILRDYAFISISKDPTIFEMHRLVQLSMRRWLEIQGEDEKLRDTFIESLHREFPYEDYELLAKCQSLFPHVRLASLQRPKSDKSFELWVALLSRAARFAYLKGGFQETKQLLTILREVLGNLFGPEHSSVVSATDLLATSYRHEGQFDKAEELQKHVLEARQSLLGVTHPLTLASIGSLALTYVGQGRFQDAQILQELLLKTQISVLGEEHLDTLDSNGSLALTYVRQGRYQDAQMLQELLLKSQKSVLGEEHPDTLASMGNLATTYMRQGRYQDAQMLQEPLLETHTRVLGDEHPNTLAIMGNLAMTYMRQGRYQDAQMLQEPLWETEKRVLGDEHPNALISMGNLASAYMEQGQYQDTLILLEPLLETQKSVLGDEHPNTLLTMRNLATAYMKQGRYQDAQTLQEPLLKTHTRVLGEEHPDTLAIMGNLTTTYINQGRLQDAQMLAVLLLETRKRVLGEKHPHTLMTMRTVAHI